MTETRYGCIRLRRGALWDENNPDYCVIDVPEIFHSYNKEELTAIRNDMKKAIEWIDEQIKGMER